MAVAALAQQLDSSASLFPTALPHVQQGTWPCSWQAIVLINFVTRSDDRLIKRTEISGQPWQKSWCVQRVPHSRILADE
jgi:hypothetical protein